MTTPTIWVLNGPNLNLLGQREPDVYGHATLADIEAELQTLAAQLGCTVVCKQSNHEGELIEWIHAARSQSQGLIINPSWAYPTPAWPCETPWWLMSPRPLRCTLAIFMPGRRFEKRAL